MEVKALPRGKSSKSRRVNSADEDLATEMEVNDELDELLLAPTDGTESEEDLDDENYGFMYSRYTSHNYYDD
jgi:hypothetical protein